MAMHPNGTNAPLVHPIAPLAITIGDHHWLPLAITIGCHWRSPLVAIGAI
jgi:hypothetical protein